MSQELNSQCSRDILNEAFIESNSIATTQQLPQQPHQDTPSKSFCIWREVNSQRPKKTKPVSELYQRSVRQSIHKITASIEQSLAKTQSPHRRNREQPNQSISPKSAVGGMTARTASVSKLKQRRVMVLSEAVCSICLNIPSSQTAKLPCQHLFCYQCIQFWAQSSSKCPYCRKEYNRMTKNTGEVVQVEPRQPIFEDPDDYISDPCYVCGTFEDIPMLLLCDLCQNKCCHINCDPRIVREIPDEWICAFCEVAQMETQVLSQPPSESKSQRRDESEGEAVQEPPEDKPRYNLRNRDSIGVFTRIHTRRQAQANTIAARTRSKQTEGAQASGDPLTRRMMRTRREFRRRRNF